MTQTYKKPGAKKKYTERITISHSIELETLAKLDAMTDIRDTRTYLINRAIEEYIRKYGKQ